MATNEEKITSTTSEKVEKVEKTVVEEKPTKKSNRESELEAQLAAMMEMVKSLQSQINNNKSVTPTVVVTAPSTDVTLVYMSDSEGVVQTNNTTLNCTRFGEEFTLPRTEFDAIVGKYRKWFDIGILAVSSNNIEVAAAKGIKTDKEYGLTADTLAKLGKMSPNELEDLWNETQLESHKVSIVTYFKRKYMENKEAGYRDRAKIDLLNRLTDGGFEREATEVSGGNLKIRPTELI